MAYLSWLLISLIWIRYPATCLPSVTGSRISSRFSIGTATDSVSGINGWKKTGSNGRNQKKMFLISIATN